VFIGVVDLVDVHIGRLSTTRSFAGQPVCFKDGVPIGQQCSEWAMTGYHHLELANPRPLPEPIPARGMLGLWTPPAEVLEQVMAVTP
jgi:hypothetical protein